MPHTANTWPSRTFMIYKQKIGQRQLKTITIDKTVKNCQNLSTTVKNSQQRSKQFKTVKHVLKKRLKNRKTDMHHQKR